MDTKHIAVRVVSDVVRFAGLALVSRVEVLSARVTRLTLDSMFAHADRCSRPNWEGAVACGDSN